MDLGKNVVFVLALSHIGEKLIDRSEKTLPLDPHPTRKEPITPMGGRHFEIAISGVGSQLLHPYIHGGGFLFVNSNNGSRAFG